MRQTGVITAIDDTTAKVLIQRHSSCGSCTACKMGQEDELEIKAINDAGAQIGQWVYVDMSDQDVLTAAFMVYVIPLLTLLMGIIGGNFLLSTMGVGEYKDVYAAIIGFATMAASFILLKKRESKIKQDKRFLPVITEVMDEHSACH